MRNPLRRHYAGPVERTPGKDVPRVVVLGGGYAAIKVCRGLRRQIAAGQLAVTVVSADNFHVFHGFVGEMITGRVSPSHILTPVRRVFAPARVHVGEITRIDLRRKVAVVARDLDGHRTEVPWDHVVICLGTADRTDAYPGLLEHAFKLREYRDCFALKNHILGMFEQADVETDPEERRRLLTFFVAGGGYAGTEVAGELSDFARRLTQREYPGVRYEECRVVLVHPGPTLLPELGGTVASQDNAHPRLVEFATKRMGQLGVEVRTNTRVEFATPNEVTLSNGERIATRTIISTVGTRPHDIVANLALPKDDRGRIRTELTGLVEGEDSVWAAGDCAAFPLPRGGGASPAVALYAYQHGTHIARNLRRQLIDHRPLQPFSFGGLGQGASVGRRSAVAELKGMEFTGLTAWVIWRILLTYFFPSWDRRLHLMADWAIWPFVGRDVVAMRVGMGGDYDVRHNVFQPGEIIVTEQRAGRYIHIIVDGEVEILHSAGGHEVVLKTLGPGETFGQRWLESFETESARAKTVVNTLALRREQAPRLQELIKSASPMFAESAHFPTISLPVKPKPPGGGQEL